MSGAIRQLITKLLINKLIKLIVKGLVTICGDRIYEYVKSNIYSLSIIIFLQEL